jgi:hypothetical protein
MECKHRCSNIQAGMPMTNIGMQISLQQYPGRYADDGYLNADIVTEISRQV